MFKRHSKALAISLTLFVALFTGSWTKILSHSLLLAAVPAGQQDGKGGQQGDQQGQQGKNEGEHEDVGAAANDSHEDKGEAGEKAEANDKENGEVETANDVHNGDQTQEDRQADQQSDTK